MKRMRESGQFRVTNEILLHSIEEGGAERFVGLELSQGGVATLLKNGVREDEITALRESARRLLRDAIVPWYFSYRMRVGVKQQKYLTYRRARKSIDQHRYPRNAILVRP